MELIKKYIAFGLICSIHIYAEYGCMDTSYHLAQLNDPKEYYFVKGADGGPCSCPCSKYCAQYRCSLPRGQCPVCGHFRVPRSFKIIRKNHEPQEFPPAHSPNLFKIPILRKKLPTNVTQPQP